MRDGAEQPPSSRSDARASAGEQHTRLSPREMAIAELVAQGFPNPEIGRQLGISRWTVASHLRRIFTKLRVRSRTEMIVKLISSGQIRPSNP